MVQLLLALAFLNFAEAQEGAQSEAEIFRTQVEQLNERYENFFSRQAEKELYFQKLKQGIPELREERQTETREKREALRLFRQEPRIKPDTTALEAEFEAEKRAQELIHERHRKAHVNRRDQLRRISESARKIPEKQDAGLE